MGLGIKGIRFTMHYAGKEKIVELPFLGEHAVYTALRAAAVGFLDGLSWDEVVVGLRSSYSQIRLSVLRTACGAMLIDDSYNAAPESTIAALKLLGDLQGHRIAVLGDMLELGKYEKEGHEQVGSFAAKIADELIAVGPRARMIAESAHLAGMDTERIRLFDHSEEAANYLASSIKDGDVLLVKGSRGMRMEKIVQRIGNN
jgi:UDP-N-acetylmuramoyl-tripeptide--D-alanyl-D-alanine ligase